MTSDAGKYDHLRISGQQARLVIKNCHLLLRKNRRYKGLPLWSMVSDIAGHGSGYSIEICRSASLDPHQLCTANKLKDLEGTGQ